MVIRTMTLLNHVFVFVASSAVVEPEQTQVSAKQIELPDSQPLVVSSQETTVTINVEADGTYRAMGNSCSSAE